VRLYKKKTCILNKGAGIFNTYFFYQLFRALIQCLKSFPHMASYSPRYSIKIEFPVSVGLLTPRILIWQLSQPVPWFKISRHYTAPFKLQITFININLVVKIFKRLFGKKKVLNYQRNCCKLEVNIELHCTFVQ
jgi:hypothetical protein